MLAPTLTFKLVERSLGKALKALPPHSLLSRFREWLESERCFSMRFSLSLLDALSMELSKLSANLRAAYLDISNRFTTFVKLLNIALNSCKFDNACVVTQFNVMLRRSYSALTYVQDFY